jgi:acyl-CoA synthetase (AMP-forming)/AMP-acid ligase II
MARQFPNRPAIFHGTQAVATYAQWAQRCAHLAQQFQDAGLQPGERIAMFMHNHPRYLEVMFGAWWAGLAVVPINAKLHVREVQWIVDNSQASWAFVTANVTADTGEQLTGNASSTWTAQRPMTCGPCLTPAMPCRQSPSLIASQTTSLGCSTPAAPQAAPRA